MKNIFFTLSRFILLFGWGIAGKYAKPYIGETAYAVIWVLVILIFVSAYVIDFLPFFGGTDYSLFMGGGKKAEQIRAHGRSAMATVIELGENSGGGTMTINNQPVLNLKLLIDDGTGSPYEVSFDTLLGRSTVPQFQPGATFGVKIDPEDNQKVVYDPNADVSTAPEIEEIKSIGSNITDEDDRLIQSEGRSAMARIVDVVDTGNRNDSNLVYRFDYELYIPNETPVNVSKEHVIPSDIAQKTSDIVGRTFSAIVHPHDNEKFYVMIDFNSI